MLPPDSSPDSANGGAKARSKRLVWQIAAALAVVVLVVGFVAAFQVASGVRSKPNSITTSNQTTADDSPTGTPTATATPAPTATPTPTPTPTPVPKKADLRVTQNQDMRPACIDDTDAYTVQVANSGNVTVNWQVVFPVVATLPVRPSSPASGYPSWGVAAPSSGSLAAGQSTSFQITPMWAMPCGGASYAATIKLSFPQGGSQPGITLTYAGTGPARFSNIVVTQNQDYSESCAGGTPPPPAYTVTLSNTGNYRAYVYTLAVEQSPMGSWWADATTTTPSGWIAASGTLQIVMTPQSWIACNGTTYHMKVFVNTAQGTTQQLMLTDTVS